MSRPNSRDKAASKGAREGQRACEATHSLQRNCVKTSRNVSYFSLPITLLTWPGRLIRRAASRKLMPVTLVRQHDRRHYTSHSLIFEPCTRNSLSLECMDPFRTMKLTSWRNKCAFCVSGRSTTHPPTAADIFKASPAARWLELQHGPLAGCCCIDRAPLRNPLPRPNESDMAPTASLERGPIAD
jgi:hypothetical protein